MWLKILKDDIYINDFHPPVLTISYSKVLSRIKCYFLGALKILFAIFSIASWKLNKINHVLKLLLRLVIPATNGIWTRDPLDQGLLFYHESFYHQHFQSHSKNTSGYSYFFDFKIFTISQEFIGLAPWKCAYGWFRNKSINPLTPLLQLLFLKCKTILMPPRSLIFCFWPDDKFFDLQIDRTLLIRFPL